MRKLFISCIIILSFNLALSAQNKAKAEMYYEEAMELSSIEGETTITKATIEKAIALYKKAILADSSFGSAYEQLATDYWSIGQSKKAYETLALAQKSAPNDLATFTLLEGIFKESEGLIPEANQLYKKSIALFDTTLPSSKSLYSVFYRSLAYYLTDNVDIAIEKYKEAVEKGYYQEDDYEELYNMQLELLETMDLMEYIEMSILNKYGLL